MKSRSCSLRTIVRLVSHELTSAVIDVSCAFDGITCPPGAVFVHGASVGIHVQRNDLTRSDDHQSAQQCHSCVRVSFWERAYQS